MRLKKRKYSEARRAASRANGAKSRGPVTPEGRQRSSMNSIKHGILATALTFSEDQEKAFRTRHDGYMNRFEPRDQYEYDLVEEATVAKSKLRLVWIWEARELRAQMLKDQPDVNREWDEIDLLDRQAIAFSSSLKESNMLPTLHRYERQLTLQAEKAIRQFRESRQDRLPPIPETPEPVVPNEPEPSVTPTPAAPCEPESHEETAEQTRPDELAAGVNDTPPTAPWDHGTPDRHEIAGDRNRPSVRHSEPPSDTQPRPPEVAG